jgi:AraC-like DNA-binding protein
VLTFSPSGVLTLIALAYSLLLAFKLLTQSGGDTIANALLASVCFSMSAWTATSLARDLGLYVSNPHLIYIVTPMFYLLGPALLAYTKRITIGTHPFGHPLAWMHLIPFALFIIAAVPFYRLDAEEKLRIFQGTQSAGVFLGMLLLIMLPHMLIYTLLCLRPIRRYEKSAKDHFSDIEYGNLRWLKRLCVGMLVLVLMDGFLSRLIAMTPWAIDAISPSFVMRMGLLFYVVFFAFSALGQPPFMYRENAEAEDSPANNAMLPDTFPVAEETEQREKYARSGLRDDSARYYVAKLHALMRDQKVYLDCDLTLRTLAAKVNLRPHHLSQILNEQLRNSFYDYINEHRVAHAKQLLTADTRAAMSILDVAFASGYKNKVSFYSAFKRFVGTTPTQYRDEQTRKTSHSAAENAEIK